MSLHRRSSASVEDNDLLETCALPSQCTHHQSLSWSVSQEGNNSIACFLKDRPQEDRVPHSKSFRERSAAIDNKQTGGKSTHVDSAVNIKQHEAQGTQKATFAKQSNTSFISSDQRPLGQLRRLRTNDACEQDRVKRLSTIFKRQSKVAREVKHPCDPVQYEDGLRRRNMRTVSKEDYLLARGANPRTGIVTPGMHSATNSLDEIEPSRASWVERPAKWRQRGDEWISLGVGEPTPLPNPPPGNQSSRIVRHLRTPPKLAAPQYGCNTVHDQGLQKRFVNHVPSSRKLSSGGEPYRLIADYKTDVAQLPTLAPKEGMHFGAQAQSADLIPNKDTSKTPVEVAIRRKPVGSLANQKSQGKKPWFEERRPWFRDLSIASTETAVAGPSAQEQERSSSAPSPRKYMQFNPYDVGRNLPDKPDEIAVSVTETEDTAQESQGKHFLGPERGNWIEKHRIPNSCRTQGLDTSRRCLQTNKIRYLSPLLTATSTDSTPVMTADTGVSEDKKCKQMGGRGGNADHLSMQNMMPSIPPRQYPLMQEVRAGQRIQPYPNSFLSGESARLHYSPPLRSQRGIITSPHPMARLHNCGQREPILDDMFIPPHNITSTNTAIPIPMSTSTHNMAIAQLDGGQGLSKGSSSTMVTTRSRGMSRPRMADRTGGTQSIPKVTRREELRDQRMTGTRSNIGHGGRESEIQIAQNRQRADLTQKSASTTNGTVLDASPDHAEVEILEVDGTTKRCTHCQDSLFSDKLRNTDMSIRTQGDHGAGENHFYSQGDRRLNCQEGKTVLKQVGESRESLEQGGDPHYHWSCCPICCAEGCHEGCLGHPQSSATSLPVFPHRIDYPLTEEIGILESLTKAFRNFTQFSSSPGARECAQKMLQVTDIIRPSSSIYQGKSSFPDAVVAARSAMNLTPEGSPTQRKNRGRHGSPADTRITPSKLGLANMGVKRNVSGASIASIRTIEIPGLNTVSSALEIFSVPFGALKMWTSQHPQVLTFGKQALDRSYEMLYCLVDTTRKLYRISYVYSKTGRIEVKKFGGLGGLVMDCMRSLVYLVIFGAVVAFFGRTIGLVVRIGWGFVWGLKAVWYLVLVLRKVLGLGLMW